MKSSQSEVILYVDEQYQNYCSSTKKPISRSEFIKRHTLNDKNRPVTEKFINGIFKKYSLNHKVVNFDMYQRAFVHDSYIESNIDNVKFIRQIKNTTMVNKKDIKKIMPMSDRSYQRLEYLGDSYIHSAIAKYLYNRYPSQGEGFLTKVRTRLENGKEMSRFSRALGLHEYVVISQSIEVAGGRLNNYKILEDVFEAFMGAVSLEVSADECFKFVINIIESEADIADMICYENNHKGVLMKICHKKKWDDIDYTDITPDNVTDKKFRVQAKCGDDIKMYYGYGKGKSKREAEQKAAKEILIKLGLIYNDNIDDEEDVYGEYHTDGEFDAESGDDEEGEVEDDQESGDVYGEFNPSDIED